MNSDRVQNAKDGNFRPTDASRNAAREKIQNHSAAGGSIATLPAASGKGDRVGKPSHPARGECSSQAKHFCQACRPAVLGSKTEGFQAKIDISAVIDCKQEIKRQPFAVIQAIQRVAGQGFVVPRWGESWGKALK